MVTNAELLSLPACARFEAASGASLKGGAWRDDPSPNAARNSGMAQTAGLDEVPPAALLADPAEGVKVSRGLHPGCIGRPCRSMERNERTAP